MKFLLLLFYIAESVFAQNSYSIKNISYQPGQKLFVGLAGESLGSEIHVQVFDADGKPAVGIPVRFELVQKPGKAHGEKIETAKTLSDADGIASTHFTLGDQAGDYVIIAGTLNMNGETPTILIRAQRTAWWMFLVFGLFGGMGIFLFGMKMGSTGLQKIAGDKLRSILSTVTKNRFMGLLFGIFITAVLQSSTATSVMVVGLVSTSLLTLTQAIGVLMGAHIGTTLTVQLIAFNISDYALLLVAVGFVLTITTKRKMTIYIGESLMGFGLIFFGMAVMSQSIAPLKYMPAFAQKLIELKDSPIFGILFSALFTAMIHSSGATISLCVVLAGEGLISLDGAIPMVLGANIGTCITALMASVGAGSEGKRAAVAYAFFSIAGALMFAPFMKPFEQLVLQFTSYFGSDDVTRQIANAHMLFNVLNASILIFFVSYVAQFLTKMIPDRKAVSEFAPKFLNNDFLDTPEVALEQGHLEELRLITWTREIFDTTRQVFQSYSLPQIEKIKERRVHIDLLENEIRKYLTRLSQKSVSLFQSHRLMRLLLTIDDLRHIVEQAVTMADQAEHMHSHQMKFSEEGKRDLDHFFDTVHKRLLTTLDGLENENAQAMQDILKTKHDVVSEEIHLRQSHLDRLQKGLQESLNTSSIHLDLLTVFKRVDTFNVKMAHEVIEQFVN